MVPSHFTGIIYNLMWKWYIMGGCNCDFCIYYMHFFVFFCQQGCNVMGIISLKKFMDFIVRMLLS